MVLKHCEGALAGGARRDLPKEADDPSDSVTPMAVTLPMQLAAFPRLAHQRSVCLR